MKTKSEKSTYTKPSWAGLPPTHLYVDVIREGAVLEFYHLGDKDHYIIGSLEGSVDIVYTNPAISRQHAVIQFRSDGKAFIKDLNSTHGSWKGEERLTPDEFVALEAGDRLTFGHKNAKRAFVIREASEADYPEAVRSQSAAPSDTLTGVGTTKRAIFDSSGQLTASALQTLETAAGRRRADKETELPQTEENHEEKSKKAEPFLRFYNPETEFLNVSLLKRSQEFSTLTSTQIDLLRKIESLQTKTTASVSTRNEDGDPEEAAVSSSHPELNAQQRSNVRDLIEDFFDSFAVEEAQPLLSESTKQAMDNRLFDEDDVFFDRSGPCQDLEPLQSSKEAIRKKLYELDAEIQKEEALLTHLQAQADATSAEDVLDKFMRQNQKNLEASQLAALREKRAALQQALDGNPPAPTAKSTLKRAAANRAVAAASEAVAQIARNHEVSCKRQCQHYSSDSEDSS